MRHVLSAALLLAFASPLLAQGGRGGQPNMEVQGTPALAREVGIDQNLDAQAPPDLAFRDEDDNAVRLGDYFRQRPVVLVLAYFRCPKLCSMVLNGLTDTFRLMSFEVGREFDVVTVSFDPRDTPEMAAEKKKSYLQRYGHPEIGESWHFLTGDKEQIDALARAVGFRYRYDEKEDQYAHASGIMVLTPQGRVSRYFYGIRYSPRDLRLGLVEASANKIGSPVDQLLLLCLHYDPRSGTYSSVMDGLRVAGVVTLAGMVSFFVWSWRRNRRRGTATPPLAA